MGEVYLAEDLNLGRRVALKLLPPRFTQDPERVRRFAQEARAVSTLNHPNILTIYEIGQAGEEAGAEATGAHFIAMEYVEGRTLRQQITAKRLTLEESLDIAVQIAEALAAAHGAGITHRDIKPENIMLRNDGYVKVLDFGLAKLTENNLLRSFDPSVTQAETIGEPPADIYATTPLAGDRANTSPGVILGTVSYMSPEQARGQKVDARTDLFNLGLVLYEMVAGRPPFQASSTGDMLVAILDRQQPPLARFADIPDELEWIVTKALAKDREDRYQLAKSLLTDLKRLYKRLELSDAFIDEDVDWGRTQPLSGSAQEAFRNSGRTSGSRSGSNSGGVLTPSGQIRSGAKRALRVIDSLAVLPFSSASDDQDLTYLSEAIPESLILNLSRLPQLRVKAWSTVARYRNRDVEALEIGRELEARAVFTGRLFQIGGQLVIKVELVDTEDGSQIWGAQYQRKLDDLFTVESELAREICDHLKLRLSEEERERLARRYTENVEAYQHYLKGRFYWHQRSGQGLRKAIEHFNAAIQLDDDYALAYSGLADSFILLGVYGAMPPRAIMPKAKAAALRALAIDQNLAEAHASLGAIHAWYDWDWPSAEREFKRAIELNPANANAHHWYGSIYLTALCRFDEAMEMESKALELEPMAMVIRSNLAWICYQARRYDEAVGYCREALDLEPNFVLAQFYLGISLARLRQFDEAITVLKQAVEASGAGALVKAGLANAYAESGDQESARRILEELRTFPASKDVSPFFLALIYAGLRERDRALQMLEDTFEERYCWIVHIKSEPAFDVLRGEERFAGLLERMGLKD